MSPRGAAVPAHSPFLRERHHDHKPSPIRVARLWVAHSGRTITCPGHLDRDVSPCLRDPQRDPPGTVLYRVRDEFGYDQLNVVGRRLSRVPAPQDH